MLPPKVDRNGGQVERNGGQVGRNGDQVARGHANRPGGSPRRAQSMKCDSFPLRPCPTT
jgi:hypothetical protein